MIYELIPKHFRAALNTEAIRIAAGTIALGLRLQFPQCARHRC